MPIKRSRMPNPVKGRKGKMTNKPLLNDRDGRLVAFILDYVHSDREQFGTNDRISQERLRNMLRYRGYPYGDERVGRSQAVAWDVFEIVENAMPPLLELFFSGPQIVRARLDADEVVGPVNQAAINKLENDITDVLNYIFLVKNPGFKIVSDIFKDGLLQKNGIGKVSWEEKERRIPQEAQLMEADFIELKGRKDVEIIGEPVVSFQLDEMGLPLSVYHVKYYIKKKIGGVVVESIAPEEFYIDPMAVTMQESIVAVHTTFKSKSDLFQAGFPKDKVNAISTFNYPYLTNQEKIVRYQNIDTTLDLMRMDAEMGVISDAYIYYDFNDDGINELRRVIVSQNGVLLLNEEWEIGMKPFFDFTSVPIPHSFYGLCLADVTQDIQRQNTNIMRQLYDNLYMQNNRMRYVVAGQVINLDTLLSGAIGGVIMERQPNSVRWEEPPQSAANNLPILEWIKGMKEERTGVTRLNQGLDPDSINKTARGQSKLMAKGDARSLLMGRQAAESLKSCFLLIYKFLKLYQTEPITLNWKDQVRTIDVAGWPESIMVDIDVGLGTGNQDAKNQSASELLEIMATVVQYQGGAQGPLVTMDNIYAACLEKAKAAGFPLPEKYFTAPNPEGEEKDPQVMQLEQQMQVMQQENEALKVEVANQEEIAAAEMAKAEASRYQAELRYKSDLLNFEIEKARIGLEAEKLKLEMAKAQASDDVDKAKVGLDAIKATKEKNNEGRQPEGA